MNDKRVVELLIRKEEEINSRIHNAITEIMRLGYDTERGKKEVSSMISSIQYSLEDLERLLSI